MEPSRARTIAALAGLGALVVALLGAAYWREIYFYLKPRAKLWGSWELVESSHPAHSKDASLTLKISKDGTLRVDHRLRQDFLAQARFYDCNSMDFRFEDAETLYLSGPGLRFIRKFRFQGIDILVIENPGFLDRYRLPTWD